MKPDKQKDKKPGTSTTQAATSQYDPPAWQALQIQLDPVDRLILERFASAFEAIAKALVAQSTTMTAEEKAEVAADQAAIKGRWSKLAGSLDDELAAIKKTGTEPAA